jgi:hypothetical protein
MGGMPYHLEKGPIFAVFDALYRDRNRLRDLLYDLWRQGSDGLGNLGMITSPMYPDPSNPVDPGPDRRTSMLRKWFGDDQQGNRQQPFSDRPPLNLTTGYWTHYYGDVRSIVAETLMRAAEVSLGVDHPAQVPDQNAPPPGGSRHWPVEFFWKCGQARFEGWVTWREHTNQAQVVTGGQVNVIFATPATPDLVLRRPGDGADPIVAGAWQKWQGMWVCSHSDHQQYRVITCLPTADGRWLVPVKTVMYTEGRDVVGAWAPEFGFGGATPAPDVFEPEP